MTDLVYAVGDIHGDLEELQRVVARIDADAAGHAHRVVFLGDLVDRRADSRGVIELLMAGQAAGRPWIVLKGNHDRLMTLFIRHGRADPCLRRGLDWLNPRLGGDATLASYGIDIAGMTRAGIRSAALRAVPAAHLDFLEGLPDRHETEHVFFCHAGIRPGVPLAEQTEDDLLWIRKPFHDHPARHPKLIVHGHTPVDAVTHYGNRINIDTGCAYGGPLSVIRFDGDSPAELTWTGRAALSPRR